MDACPLLEMGLDPHIPFGALLASDKGRLLVSGGFLGYDHNSVITERELLVLGNLGEGVAVLLAQHDVVVACHGHGELVAG